MNEYPGTPGPFDKDEIEPKKNLSEKDFIQEPTVQQTRGSVPLLIWVALLTMAIALVWGSVGSFQGLIKQEVEARPFLDVTNRQFSVFLWQYPVFMRAYAKNKTGYLPGFQYVEKHTLYLDKADEVVNAPPEIIFLYHTWLRLLGTDYISRPINPSEFEEFLAQVPEWNSENWKQAPEGYIQLVQSQNYKEVQDLQSLPETSFPLVVKQSFLGWKNYFKEGAAINAVTVTFKEVQEFLKQHPYYARNYWKNIPEILGYEVAGSKYLEGFLSKNLNLDEIVPSEQLAPFLKISLYNAQQAVLGQ